MKKIIKNLSNIPGWRTNRKIVVIESDDWGSIRMSSNESYSEMLNAGLAVDKGNAARYNKYDTLATKSDLTNLFETLSSIKDNNNSSAKFTAVSVVANPDFDKIKEYNFENYYYEPFTKTLERYNRADAFPLWAEGKSANVFVPEFHGREHLNVLAWMRALKANDTQAQLAFEHKVWGYQRESGINFQAAFDLEFASDLELQKEIVRDGLTLFKKLHGYNSRFFVPPNGPLNSALEIIAADCGVEYMATQKIQNEVLGSGKTKKNFRYLGMKNKNKQTYITRNCFFEPSCSYKDEISSCMGEIETAFKWKKPAVISSHRINYVGALDIDNRDRSLYELKKLLARIIKKWPDIEFMTSSELGDIITKR